MVPIRRAQREINAADVEHIGALVAGGVLFLNGMRKGGLVGSAFKLAGLGFLWRGQQGYRRLYNALGVELTARPTGVGRQNVRVESSIVVDRPSQELYRIWRNLSNLPVFMDHLISVNEINDERSLWVARAPAGTVIKWDAQIINDIENHLIAFVTLEGSGVDMGGSVRFTELSPSSTRITVVFRYDPPADMLGVWIAKAFQIDPQTQIEKDLRRFKAIMELGNPRAKPGIADSVTAL